VLAEAFGECEKVSPQRLQIYAGDLADLDPRQLDIAFKRARTELKFFPKISELGFRLRSLSLSFPQDQPQSRSNTAEHRDCSAVSFAAEESFIRR
jgi:hypothetical protein